MLEAKGDIFKQPDADAIVFTSNGILKSDGTLVMGAGIAKAFKDRFWGLDGEAGLGVKMRGNHVNAFFAMYSPIDPSFSPETVIFSFPTKHHFKDPSDINLIERSAKELVTFVNSLTLRPLNKIYMTRPGCGMGQLKWPDVKKVIEPILDNRFIVLTP